jgi:sulfite reductase (ferredoxin)
VRETAAQRNERIKAAKAPWDILPDIERYARAGYDAIDPDDRDVRFRAWGIYTQGDGGGVYGRAVPCFMMRVRIPGGLLTARQARAVAELARRYGRGLADLTDRQNIQLHWVGIEDVPAVFRGLAEVGLTTQGACGDDTRNVTGCPLAGLDADAICDATAVLREVDRRLNGNPAYGNLPRKFKICVTGCRAWCSHPEINDVGMTAVRRGDEVGFSLRLGGGLSTAPRLASRLDCFVPWARAADVAEAVAAIFRDSQCLREHRHRARLKFLYLQYGWDDARLLREIEARLGERLPRAVAEEVPPERGRDHVGIGRQRQDGLCYVGAVVRAGRSHADQLQAIATLAEAYGSGELRLTNGQNVVIPNVPASRAEGLATELAALGLPVAAGTVERGTVACTGKEFCKLAITETKAFAAGLAAELDRRLPGLPGDLLRLHVTGCPNSCGQHWIAELGLQGVRMPGGEDGYEVFVGGGLGRDAAFVRRLGVRFPAREAADRLEVLLRGYMVERRPGESFRDFARRTPDAVLEGWLSGGRPTGVGAAGGGTG